MHKITTSTTRGVTVPDPAQGMLGAGTGSTMRARPEIHGKAVVRAADAVAHE
jgi:hypothetical protein